MVHSYLMENGFEFTELSVVHENSGRCIVIFSSDVAEKVTQEVQDFIKEQGFIYHFVETDAMIYSNDKA